MLKAIVDGRRIEAAPLEGLEEIEIDGTLYEAFNTSGGLGSLAETYGSRTQVMDYKTMRYPGHCEQMRLLMNDLKLNHDRGTLKRILENAVPATMQDVVIVFVTVSGTRADESGQPRFLQDTYARKIYSHTLHGTMRSAIQITTASSLAAMLDLLAQGRLPQRGFVRQEEVALETFLANRFGQVYGTPALAQAA